MNGFKKHERDLQRAGYSQRLKPQICVQSGSGRPKGTGAEAGRVFWDRISQHLLFCSFFPSSLGSIAGYFQIQD